MKERTTDITNKTKEHLNPLTNELNWKSEINEERAKQRTNESKT